MNNLLNLIQCNVYVSRAGRKTREKKKKKKNNNRLSRTVGFQQIVGSRLGKGSNGQPVLGVEKQPIAS
jgi:hypothetical protein